MPSGGDTFFLAIDQIPSNIRALSSGSNQRWDFTTLLAPYSRAYVWRSAGRSKSNVERLFTQTEAFTEALYLKTGSELSLSYASGRDPLGISRNAYISFSPALVVRKYPMRYGDQSTSKVTMTILTASEDVTPAILRKLPFQPDSLRFRVTLERFSHIDAWGRLIIPGGIHEVLRQKQEEHRTIQVDARVGQRKWHHITHLVPLRELFPNPDVLTYIFYSNTTPEPIATVSVHSQDNTTLRVEYKAHDTTEDLPLLLSTKASIFAFPNPVIVSARFEFFNLPAGEYELSIYNLLGVPIIRKHYQISGNRTERLDVSELRKGAYLYTLKDERGNTIATKRLMVIRP